MASLANINSIEDEDALEALLKQTEDLNIKREIRRRQKEIREKRQAAYEASKGAKKETAQEMRLRMAAEEKERKMKEFQQKASEKKEGGKEDIIKERQRMADEEKQRKLQQFKEMGKDSAALCNAGITDVMKDKGGPTAQPQNRAQPARKPQQGPLGGGSVYGPKVGDPGAGGGSVVAKNPNSVKELLLEWCKRKCEGYDNVNITNFSSSWADGMAFCALIHHFYPNTFDYSKLNPKNRRGNFKLAFTVAEKEADIAPLLDVEDMVRMKVPDWKCVFTYLQGFYRRFEMNKQ